MKRRDILLGAGAAGLTATARAVEATAGCADPAAAFAAARAKQPWTLAFASQGADLEPLALALHGRLPRGLAGAFYRNGPARHELGGQRYRHWFDGDGALQRYDLGLGGRNTITHRLRFVRTPKFEADSAAGRPVRAAFATHPPGMEPVRSADSINVANTSVAHHGGRLLALWEGGSAFELDPQTLATRGAHAWSPELAGMPFSAHPRIEPDGTMWNFGVTSAAGALTLYRIGRNGALQQTATLRVPDITMVHDFAVTERHLVFLLPPYVFEGQRWRDGATFFDSHVWRPDLGLRVMVLDKADLQAAPRWFTLPPGFVFHLGNACEEGGVIRLDCMRSPDAVAVREGFLDVMCGRYSGWESTSPMLVELDLASDGARQTVLPMLAEFPRVDPRHVGRRYSALFMLARDAAMVGRPLLDTVARLDLKSGRIERFRYGGAVVAEEHLFVPRPGGAEGEGWLLGSALDLARPRTLFSVFDAQRLADGPLVQGEMARTLPVGLHGTFVGRVA
jgi:all-trans-8'-apo-beta-carotenal 15,15'-oxygenase